MNTPTPETDGECFVTGDFARKLERERDGYRETVQLQREEIAERTRERDEARLKLNGTIEFVLNENAQLRKVADELASVSIAFRSWASVIVRHVGDSSAIDQDTSKGSVAIQNYNQLPHVIERNK